MEETNRICPWCSTPIPSSADACPKCNALVEGAIAKDLPGLVIVDPTTKLDVPDESIIPDVVDPTAWLLAGNDGALASETAFERPSEAVRLEMRKMELETQIENAGSVVMNPTGDEAIEVNAPSVEALEALEAGLLDETGPAGETDLEELAAPWEDPELEHRVAQWSAVDPNKQ
ncbi:MAG TPA: zinc ribbon domain-containing protein [Candidatus Limnocylindrales bacterium]